MAQGQWGQGAQQGLAPQPPAFQGNPSYAQAGYPGPMGQAGYLGQVGQGGYGQGHAHMGYPYPPQAPMGYTQAPQGVNDARPAGMGAGVAAGMGAAQAAGQHQGRGPGMSQLMEELAGGGSGLSSLTQMLNLDDKELWKGALIGAAVVLLLTNESVQNTLFKTGVRARDALKSGVDKAKARAQQAVKEPGASEPGAVDMSNCLYPPPWRWNPSATSPRSVSIPHAAPWSAWRPWVGWWAVPPPRPLICAGSRPGS